MSSEKKLFLLDAYALIFRSYYAFIKNPRITSYGLNTNAIFGFTTTLLEILEKYNPTHIAVCFDHKSENIRKKEYPLYKANRDETPEDIKRSEPFIRQIIDAFNIPIIEKAGYEADDVIVTLATRAEKEGYITYMMTPDKDFGQAVTDKILMFKPARGGNPPEIMGPAEVCEKFGLDRTEQIIDYLGLMGDAVDNIPGVPGVGAKTASKLLKEFGSMDAIYENTDKLKGKLRERIEDNKEQAYLSKHLATIITDVPVEFNEESLILEEPNKERINQLFTELEFRTLTKRVFKETMSASVSIQGDLFAPSSSATASSPLIAEKDETLIELKDISNTKHDYQLIDSQDKRKFLISELEKQKSFCFDTETTSLEEMDAEVLGLAISYENSKAYYVNMPNNFEETKAILGEFKHLFNDLNIEKIAQNLKYDLKVLLKYDIHIAGPQFDTMLAHYLTNPDGRHSMDILSEKYLNYKPVSITELIGKKGKNQLNFRDVPLDKATEYASEDADVTFQLKGKLHKELMDKQVAHLMQRLEMPLVPVLSAMEMEGIRIDADFLNDYSKELEGMSKDLEKTIFEISGANFNIASPKQMGEVLFDHMKIDSKAKKTKTGQYKTDEATLQKLAGDHEIVSKIVDYRKVNKLRSTYVDALPKLIHPKTGRVHTNYAQAVAATGRLSSTNPNLQNIPIRTDMGKEIRKAFVPRDDNHTLLAVDYSQIELRIVASVAEDQGMMEAFHAGVDIHVATAAKVFGIEVQDVTKEQRYKAKSVNFGLIYGQGAFGLSQNLGIKRGEAKDLIDAYFEQFGGVKQYMDDTIKFCRDNGFVKTIMGRKRFIPDINSSNQTVVGFAERNAINAPIQGSAADMIKLAMINIHNRFSKMDIGTRMLLQVHDELLFDVPKAELEEITAVIKEEMENAMPLKVPVIAEAGHGDNWLEAH
ncbi:MAG: DNA polymerase I [Bacteroidetes bacterium]|nr:MAG: DNA polymerase I [Bacteroidota bacterium]